VEPPPSPRKPKLEKVTLYVRPEQVVHIEEIQLQQRRRTGKRPDKSDLVQEALDLLIQKYSKTE
jgi:Arc/MetJ-type ribon-helix-helix transcriptional regulator